MHVLYLKKRSICLFVPVILAAAIFSAILFNSGKESSEVNFVDYTAKIQTERMMSHIRRLADTDDSRITGLAGEREAADYIADGFKKAGLSITRQPFPIMTYNAGSVEAKLSGAIEKNLPARELSYSASTPSGGLKAPVVYAGPGTREALGKLDVSGKIVLIERGGEFFFIKTGNAADAGAAAVMFFDPESENLLPATLVKPSRIPAVAIRRAEAESIKEHLNEGRPVEVFLKVDASVVENASENIIGKLKASRGADEARTIVVGAHYDGVDTPAANDNASGISVLMETARLLSRERLKCNVEFAAFGAEEVGLVGSYAYMDSLDAVQRSNILAMINLDMVGVGDTIRINTLKQGASSFIADLVEKCSLSFGYKVDRNFSDRSDHEVFEKNGIPVAFIECRPYGNYHTDGDTADKIEAGNLLKVSNVVASVVREAAGRPERYIRAR